jgi:hypothetical protein
VFSPLAHAITSVCGTPLHRCSPTTASLARCSWPCDLCDTITCCRELTIFTRLPTFLPARFLAAVKLWKTNGSSDECASSIFALVAPPASQTNHSQRLPSCTAVPAMASGGTRDAALPQPWCSLPVDFFKQEEDFPLVLLSYQSNSTGQGVGKTWMWAVANALREAGITSFNGYQVTGVQDWQEEWFGVLPECPLLVVMLSKSYFKSPACVAELKAACKSGKPMIPIYLDKVDISSYFLGTSVEEKKAANYIRHHIDGNCVPPPDQGFFQGRGTADFQRNIDMLVGAIKKTAGVRIRPVAHVEATVAAAPPPKPEKLFEGKLTNDVCDRVVSGELTTVVSTGNLDTDCVRRLADALCAPTCRVAKLGYAAPPCHVTACVIQ